MIAYNYNPSTLEYTGYSEADPDPMNEGVFLFPAFSTEIEPPEQILGKKRTFINGAWCYEDIIEELSKSSGSDAVGSIGDVDRVKSDNEDRISAIINELALLDQKSIRPIRSIAINPQNENDIEFLRSIESQMSSLRDELTALKQVIQ